MKKLIFAVLASLVLTGVGMTSAQAATTPPAGPALSVSLDNNTCEISVVVDSTFYTTGVPNTPSSATMKVNVSGSGNVLFQCAGQLITPAPSQGLVVNSDRSTVSACWNGSEFLLSNDWTLVITPSGKLQYSCHAHK
jgi:hypothetical protein